MPLRPTLSELFVTNLRFLELDKYSDWPHITANIYSPKDVQAQDQKLRISCTEWALFRLCELWNPHEAAYKLQPFFPPLEPLQSLNLRAALFRVLSELKKNGHLGRETLLRKTMLDDCKGERFLEIMVIFSTAVIKKIMVPRYPAQDSISVGIALATNLTPRMTPELLIPLNIAYTKSFRSIIRQKQEINDRIALFAHHINVKVHELTQREILCRQIREALIPADESLKVQREVSQNWMGNPRWPQVLLFGEESKDEILEHPFKEVWNAAIKGEIFQPKATEENLLGDLENRLLRQKRTVQKWKDFHEDILRKRRNMGGDSPSQTPIKLNSSPSFDFDQHQNLHLSQIEEIPVIERPQSSSIDNIIAEMQAELANSAKSAANKDQVQSSYSSYSPFGAQPAPQRFNPVRLSADLDTPAPKQKPRIITDNKRISMSSTAVPLSRIFSPAKPIVTRKSSTGRDRQPSLVSSGSTTPVSDDNMSTPETKEERFLLEANSMVNSVLNSTMTPVPENKMTLAERTRLSMSMAQTNTASQLDQTSRWTEPSYEISTATSVIASGPSVEVRRASLLERTQQSMSSLNSTSKPSSRKSLMMKKNRQSIVYPVNQFETPGRPRPEPMRNATPTEKLFSEDAEYTSVFKSRPRVQLSPVDTPDDDLPSALHDLKEEESDVDDTWIQSSPLQSRGL